MEEAEKRVQKLIVNLCKYLTVYEDMWKSIIKNAEVTVKTLSNLSEQMACLQKTNLNGVENFDDMLNTTKFNVSIRVEEELHNLKESINNLNKSNNELRNKMLALENSSIEMDWDGESSIVKGTWKQPSLANLLQRSLEFLQFFTSKFKSINEAFKALKLGNDRSMKDLQNAFVIDFDHESVRYLLNITQYVNDEKLIN